MPRRRSLWVYHVNTGGCNGCDIELLAALSPVYDPERFGVKLVESPRHADAFVLSGPVTVQSLPSVLEAFRVGRPEAVVALGSCACGGGIWHDSAAVLGGIDPLLKLLEEEGIPRPRVIRVPGCPPRPHAILYGVAVLLGLAEVKAAKLLAEARQAARI